MKPQKLVSVTISLFLMTLLFGFTATANDTKLSENLKSYQDSLTSGDLLAKSHGDAGLSCNDCHDDSSKAVKKVPFEDGFCLKCHEISDIDKEVVFKSRGADVHPHDEHVGDIGCADCHSMHSKSTLKCAECHVQDWMKTLPARWEQPK